MPRIFISYRRSDSEGITGRIYDHLASAFGEDSVFMDVDDIIPGEDFRGKIREAVSTCDVVLIVIGNTWLDVRERDNPEVRRLDNPNDFVRLEVETGLQRDSTRVIPLLVNRASMPSGNALPNTLRELSFKQALKMRHGSDFGRDVKRLVTTIQKFFPEEIEDETSRRRFHINWKLIVGILASAITLFLSLQPGAIGCQLLVSTFDFEACKVVQLASQTSEATQVSQNDILLSPTPIEVTENDASPPPAPTQEDVVPPNVVNTSAVISIENIDQLEILEILRQFTGGTWTIAFSPSSELLGAGTNENIVQLWDIKTGELIYSMEGHHREVRSVAFSPDGTILASGSWDRTIKLWDVETGAELITLSGHSSNIYSVAFSPDGKILASGSLDRTVKLWDIETGQEINSLEGHTNAIRTVAFSHDGTILASGSSDFSIILWDIESGNQITTLTGHTSGIESIEFSPISNMLATGSRDNIIGLWNIGINEDIFRLLAHADILRSVAFSPDGMLFASASDDNQIKIWQVSSWRVLSTLSGPESGLTEVTFSPDGTLIASGSRDGAIRIWGITVDNE